MRVVLYVIIYFLVSFPCYSKWEKVNENKIFTEYFELDTVKKIDDIIYIWSLIDYKKPQKNGNLSTKYYSIYDCNEVKYKVLSIIEYKTNMGRGRNFRYTKNIDFLPGFGGARARHAMTPFLSINRLISLTIVDATHAKPVDIIGDCGCNISKIRDPGSWIWDPRSGLA